MTSERQAENRSCMYDQSFEEEYFCVPFWTVAMVNVWRAVSFVIEAVGGFYDEWSRRQGRRHRARDSRNPRDSLLGRQVFIDLTSVSLVRREKFERIDQGTGPGLQFRSQVSRFRLIGWQKSSIWDARVCLSPLETNNRHEPKSLSAGPGPGQYNVAKLHYKGEHLRLLKSFSL